MLTEHFEHLLKEITCRVVIGRLWHRPVVVRINSHLTTAILFPRATSFASKNSRAFDGAAQQVFCIYSCLRHDLAGHHQSDKFTRKKEKILFTQETTFYAIS